MTVRKRKPSDLMAWHNTQDDAITRAQYNPRPAPPPPKRGTRQKPRRKRT